MNARERFLVVLGAVGLVLLVGLAALLIYALLRADVVTLRWWAGLATVALPATAWGFYTLGRLTARAHVDGLTQGVREVMRAATETAELRVGTAQRLRRKPRQQPPAVQVFIPGAGREMPSLAGGPVILPPPALEHEEEVEL